MGIWYLTPENEFEYSQNETMVQVQSFLQELQLWNGEPEFRVNEGIDWLAVLNGTINIENEINQLATKYADYFYVGNIVTSMDVPNRVVRIDFKISTLDKNNDVSNYENIILEIAL